MAVTLNLFLALEFVFTFGILNALLFSPGGDLHRQILREPFWSNASFTEEAQIYSFLPKHVLNPGRPLGNKVFINPFLLPQFISDQ